MNRSNKLVSVVLTTKNEEENIRNCLNSIKKQSYRNIEIIVVDNNSSDKTKSIAKQFTNLVYNFGPERSAQRNFAAKKAKGTYFMYLDADMTIGRNVIQECIEEMEHDKKLTGLYISEIVSGESFWSQVRRFERSFYDATVIDCVRFVKTGDFKKVGGFDETITGPEDWDFDKKIRLLGKTAIIESPLFHNETQFSLENYLKKKQYYMKSFDRYINKWGRNDPDVQKQFSPLYRFLIVFIENNRWKQLFLHPILTLGMLSLRLLVGLKYFNSSIINRRIIL